MEACPLDWEDIRTFLAIARARSLSGAARQLGLRQSTLSRRLEALEQRAGARLLHKTPRGYDLTALGEGVLANAERMEAEALALERAVQGRDVALSGTLRVTTVDVLATQLLPPVVASLRSRYPGIEVEILTEARSLSLSKREADVAIRMVPFEGNELVSRRLGGFAHGLYASTAYLAAHGSPLAGGPGHAVVTALEDHQHMPEFVWLAQKVPGAAAALRSNSREVQLEAARAGVGAACLARYLGDSAPGLVRIAEAGPGPRREFWLGFHADLRQMPRVRVLIEALDAELERQRPLFDPDSVGLA